MLSMSHGLVLANPRHNLSKNQMEKENKNLKEHLGLHLHKSIFLKAQVQVSNNPKKVMEIVVLKHKGCEEGALV